MRSAGTPGLLRSSAPLVLLCCLLSFAPSAWAGQCPKCYENYSDIYNYCAKDGSKLEKDSYAESAEIAGPQVKVDEAELALWRFVRGSDAAGPLEGYLKKYPEGLFSGLARLRIKELAASRAVPDDGGMVFIKGGCFKMGNIFGAGFYNEDPVHKVCVDDFYLSRYEVTVGEFREFVKETGYKTVAEEGQGNNGHKDPNWKAPGFSQEDNHPVGFICWRDAQEYLAWKARKTGKPYRLPTEAEWEYAARAGTKTRNFWGDSTDRACRYANVSDLTSATKGPWISRGFHECVDGYVYSSPVGTYEPNAFGLYDMMGNVDEWCADWYGDHYYDNSPKKNPTGPSEGKDRIIRGGTWGFRGETSFIRVSERGDSGPSYCGEAMGFRPAISK